MAKRVQGTCRVLVEQYHGTAANIWADVGSGAELRDRIAALMRRGTGRRSVPGLRSSGREHEGGRGTDPITMPARRPPREPAQTKLF